MRRQGQARGDLSRARPIPASDVDDALPSSGGMLRRPVAPRAPSGRAASFRVDEAVALPSSASRGVLRARPSALAGAAGALLESPAGDATDAMCNPGLDRARLLALHHFMKLNRRVEERLANLYRQGQVVGGLYRSLGQEATSVGAAFALEDGDLLAPLIRDLGAVLVRGYTPRECIAQFLGRAASPTLGRDGVLHMGEIGGRGVVGGMGMLGSLISVLAGCGLALRLTGRDRVCLTFIGDGGTSSTGFHDGLGFAASRRLPLVVVIENNGYAYSTPVRAQTNETDFSTRGPAYGCWGERVDGNDVLAVYDAASRAVRRAREGEGPTVIEARTFRMKGHAEHDDAAYVPRELFERWKTKDPIARYEAWLLHEGIASREDLEAAAARIETGLDEDVRLVTDSPMPDPASALAGVYADDSPFRPRPYGARTGEPRDGEGEDVR